MYFLIGIVGLWMLLAILFGIYDLQISQAVYDPSSEWAQFGAEYGEYPGYAVVGIAFIVLVLSFGRSERRELQAFAFATILLAIVFPLLFVSGLKLIVYRVRFRNLLPDHSNFTPWFASPIQVSLNNSVASFPSGHTAMAFMLLPVIFLFRKSAWKYLVAVLVVGWGVFIACSRVVIGAHYASDVLFSACFGAVVTILLYKLFYGEEDNVFMDIECPCLDQEICHCRIGK